MHEISEFSKASVSRAGCFSYPSTDAKNLNHLTESDSHRQEANHLTESDSQRQEAGQASCEANPSLLARLDEATDKCGRRTSSRFSQQENEPAQKRPRQTSQSGSLRTTSDREADGLALDNLAATTTTNEQKGPVREAKARTSSSSSGRRTGMKASASASLSSTPMKMSSSQANGRPLRASVRVATRLPPNYVEESVQDEIPSDAEENDNASNPKRKGVRKSYVLNGRRSLAPLRNPPPPPQVPDGLKGKWTYTDETRMFLADFRDTAQVPKQDMKFLLKLMARDDLVVVSEGLWNPAFEKLLRLEYLEAAFGNQVQHKFRMFSRKKEGGYAEKPEGLSMRAKDFFQYLKIKVGKEGVSRRFAFTDFKGKRHEIDVDEVSIYMIDCDVPKILPLFYDKYVAHCKMPEILPGGEMCMMNAMNREGRPFMGPNLYIAPGGGFTSLHQDGEGTVDSGHSCITGYNEVVMLRRMPEEHKHFAAEQLGYDGVHRLPHDVGTTYENIWPKKSVINKWEEMNYCPSVFVLRPGQHLHINKGRLHTFRKVKMEPLEQDDCHHELRKDLLDRGIAKRDELCISIAFDWMFLGHSREAIHEEVKTALQCADICRNVGTSSLGIPETCLLKLAMLLSHNGGTICNDLLYPIRNAACQGILPHLQAIVQQEIESGSGISNKAKIADNQQDPDSYSVDPFGADYFCHTCKKELANSYFHCLGCERLLQKDLNICRMCLEEKKYGTNIRLGVACKSRNSDIIHAGILSKHGNAKGCSCRQGICRECGYCKSCSCRCHHEFQLHYRFFMIDELKDMVKRVEKLAKASDDHMESFAETREPTAEAGNFSTEHIEKEAVLPICDSEIQKSFGEAESCIQQSLPLSVDGTDTVTSEIVSDAIPIRASEINTNHLSLPRANGRSTLIALKQMPDQTVHHDAAHIAQNALLAPSGPVLVTSKELSLGDGVYETFFEDVKRNSTSPKSARIIP
ncbi:hypothetical protein FisN_3Lh394 [Fistulifera solaris]|uniref:JmjC domain-containing protein n=1 Tax=Fistulifera solaris TaxID=1519565 RepID=A0A1Z5J8B9_FISSO|nr:hypothetical protein FisN_3Lh394 [Fistulifera solaris]|eukprot:GAX10199.1 hypothetical protein FisN_3Lh394 [Fistulifera solaris]